MKLVLILRGNLIKIQMVFYGDVFYGDVFYGDQLFKLVVLLGNFMFYSCLIKFYKLIF